MNNVFIEKCENCRYSLVNAKGTMECREDSPTTGQRRYPTTSAGEWCGQYSPMQKKEDQSRKDAYAQAILDEKQAEIERKQAEKNAERKRIEAEAVAAQQAEESEEE